MVHLLFGAGADDVLGVCGGGRSDDDHTLACDRAPERFRLRGIGVDCAGANIGVLPVQGLGKFLCSVQVSRAEIDIRLGVLQQVPCDPSAGVACATKDQDSRHGVLVL